MNEDHETDIDLLLLKINKSDIFSDHENRTDFKFEYFFIFFCLNLSIIKIIKDSYFLFSVEKKKIVSKLSCQFPLSLELILEA